MELRTYLIALRKNWWVIAIVTVLVTSGGLLAYRLTPSTYASTVTFYVSTPMQKNSNPMSAGQFAEARVNSYVELLSSEKLAKVVVKDTGVDLGPRDVMKEITAEAQLNTVLVTATVTDSSSSRSQLLAQSIADNFGKMVSDLDNQGRKDSIVVINVVSGPTLVGVVSPSLKRYGGIALLSGLVVGVLLALLRELLDTSVRTVESARGLVGAPVLGMIGYDAASKKSPLILGDKTSSVRAESFRQLRTNLQFIDAADPTDVVLVTSSMPGEGKSTTAINLALTFVEFGERVLIIEGDLRRPKVAGYLGLEGDLGLTNVLVGQVEVDQVIQSFGTGGLSFLGSGSIPPNPSELLGGSRMAELMTELRTRFDKIVIDAPPLLPVTDAVVAAASADGVVFVIRHGKTSRAQVGHAARALHTVNIRIVGTVLTMRKAGRAEKRYYGSESYYGAGALTAAEADELRARLAAEGDQPPEFRTPSETART